MGDAYVAHFVEGTFMDPVFLQLRDELIYIDDIRCICHRTFQVPKMEVLTYISCK